MMEDTAKMWVVRLRDPDDAGYGDIVQCVVGATDMDKAVASGADLMGVDKSKVQATVYNLGYMPGEEG